MVFHAKLKKGGGQKKTEDIRSLVACAPRLKSA